MSTTTIEPRQHIETALTRGAAYAVLAAALAYPDAAAFTRLKRTVELAGDGLDATPLGRLVELARATTREELEEAYVRIFTLSSSPDCPMFETAFLSTDPGQQTARMGDIAGFYRAFGVDPASPGFRPDDLPVELEFMSYLCLKEVFAAEHLGAPRVKQTARAERLFLREHLGRWGAPLGRRIALHAMACPFYFAAGEALAEWLDADIEFVRAGPIDYIEAPSMEWEAPGSDSDLLDDADLISLDEIPVER